MESACKFRGEETVDDEEDTDGEIIVPNPLLDLGLEGAVGYDCCVMNFGWECERRKGPEEKYEFSSD